VSSPLINQGLVNKTVSAVTENRL